MESRLQAVWVVATLDLAGAPPYFPVILMELSNSFRHLAISLGLGLLVGLQRERSDSALAGFRTFALVTMFGTLCSLISIQTGGWIVGAGLVALAAVIVVGNLAKSKTEHADPGLTTEVAMLLMYGVGAYLPLGYTAFAVALGGSVAVLLHLKPQMHSFAAKIGDADFKAMMQFVVITLVILPVLPDHTFGPYDVLNLHKIWLMVVLIVGISLAGYVIYKFFGERAGTLLGGFLGGLISSTATTVSYSRRSRQNPAAAGPAALVIAIASTVVFLRVLVIVASVAPTAIARVGLPLAAMLVVLVVVAAIKYFAHRHEEARMPDQENPSEMKSAILFALLFAVVLLAAAAAREKFGDRGLYLVGVLSGLTDMDAITLSTAQMIETGKLDTNTGWRLIVVAAMSNLVLKGATVGLLGGPTLLRKSAGFFAVALATGTMLLVFWPG
jgi:uncharacterized membrane protein (DUF4010 family)